MAIGDRIQVAQESTSEAILEKITDTSGIVVGSDGKKYRPVFAPDLKPEPAYGASNIYFPSILACSENGYNYYFTGDSVQKIKDSYPYTLETFLLPTTNVSIMCANRSFSILNSFKHYKGKLYYAYVTVPNTIGLGYFDIKTNTFNHSLTIPSITGSNVGGSRPSVSVYEEGYLVIASYSNLSAGSLDYTNVFKINDDGTVTILPGQPFSRTPTASLVYNQNFFFFDDYFVRFHPYSGSNSFFMEKYLYSNSSPVFQEVININLTIINPVKYKDYIVYQSNSNNVLVFVDTKNMTSVNRTVPNQKANISNLLVIDDEMFFMTPSATSLDFTKIYASPDLSVTDSAELYRNVVTHYNTTAITNTLYYYLDLGKIFINYSQGATYFQPDTPRVFVFDFRKKKLQGYKEVIE